MKRSKFSALTKMTGKCLLQLQLLIICATSTHCLLNEDKEPEQATFQLHTGVSWKTLSERPYDASFPLNFEVPWGSPEMAQPKKANLELSSHLELIFAPLDDLSAGWDDGLNSLQFNLENSVKKRQKRGIAILGQFMHYCCNLISEDTLGSMIVSEDDLHAALGTFQKHFGGILNNISIDNSKIETFSRSVVTNMNAFNKSMGTISTAMYNMSQDILNYNKGMMKSQDKMYFRIAKLFQNVMHGNYKLLTVIEEHSVIRQCNAKRIPRELISVEVLKQKLTALNTEANKFGRELMEPTSRLDKYYFMNIVSCIFTPKRVLVRVAVPLVNTANSWRAVRIYPIGFLWHQSSCEVDVKGRKFFVSRTGMVKNADSLGCTNGLCYTGRVLLAPQDDEEKCVAALWTNQTKEITKNCKVVCKKDRQLKVVETEEVNRFMVSNADKNTKMVCKGSNDSVLNSVAGVGAHLVDVPCHCQILHHDLVVVDSHFPCDNVASRSAKAALAVPTFWTKPEVHTKSGEFKVRDVKQHVNTILKLDWPQAMQVMNLSRPEEQPLRLLPGFKIEGYISFDWLMLCVLLQLVVGIYVLWQNPKLIMPKCLNNKSRQGQSASSNDMEGIRKVEIDGRIYRIVNGQQGNSGGVLLPVFKSLEQDLVN